MRTPSTWPKVGLRGASATAALLALGFGMAVAIMPAEANKVGVAAAVNPDAFSSLSGTPTNQLNIGKSIFFNERIKTTTSGLVQVLLVDGSTFTVGPDSDLVIDKFVYNPKKGTGEITTTFSKGVVRYVGGKISKNEDAVKMKTPAGALAIRGGMFQAKINSGGKGIFSFLYGVGLTFQGKNGQVYKVFQSGYTLDLTSGVPKIRPTTAADTNSIMKAFAKGGSGTGTASTGNNGGTKPGPNTKTTEASNTISEIVNTYTQTQLQTEIEQQLNQLSTEKSDGGTKPVTSDTPPPRIGGDYSGYAAGFVLDGTKEPKFVGNISPDGLTLSLNPVTNTVTADFNVSEIDPTNVISLIANVSRLFATTYAFGYTGSEPSGYVHDSNFSALAGPEGMKTTWVLFIPFANPVTVNGGFITGAGDELPNAKLCASCEFIKWGRWDARLTPQKGKAQDLKGWWVTGKDIVHEAQLPSSGNATYNGNAIGYVSARSNGAWSAPQAKQGQMNMSWNFGARTGQLNISNFDGKSFGGNLCGKSGSCANGTTHFVGRLNGLDAASNGLKGGTAGSFVGNGKNPTAGVIGNFGVGRNDWKATGIYGGVR